MRRIAANGKGLLQVGFLGEMRELQPGELPQAIEETRLRWASAGMGCDGRAPAVLAVSAFARGLLLNFPLHLRDDATGLVERVNLLWGFLKCGSLSSCDQMQSAGDAKRTRCRLLLLEFQCMSARKRYRMSSHGATSVSRQYAKLAYRSRDFRVHARDLTGVAQSLTLWLSAPPEGSQAPGMRIDLPGPLRHPTGGVSRIPLAGGSFCNLRGTTPPWPT